MPKSQNAATKRSPEEEVALLDQALEKKVCQRSYYEFLKAAWKILEPETPFVDNWHIQYLCDILQAEIERIAERGPKTFDLVVNIPPRSLKSYIFSILLCPWAWTRYPWLKFINSSYSTDLSTDHCVKGRRVIESPWYQMHWGSVFSLTTDQNVKSFYENDRTGMRFATSVKSGVTGHGGDVIVCDDLQDPMKAASDATRQAAVDHYDKVLFSRLNDQTIGLRAIVMQRLAEDDLVGHVMAKHPDRYTKIAIPVELDPEVLSPGNLAEKYKDGLFFGERFSAKFVEEAKAMGEMEYACQYGQRPAKKGGTIIKRDYFRYYQTLPPKFDRIIQGWDMTFKGDRPGSKKKQSDFVVGGCAGRIGADAFIWGVVRARLDFVQSIDAVRAMKRAEPRTREIFIEDKANGPAIISSLQHEIPGVIAWPTPDNPHMREWDKVARANAITPTLRSGNVYLPDPKIQSWVYPFLDECAMFPNGSHDDQVDFLTMVLIELFGSFFNRLRVLL